MRIIREGFPAEARISLNLRPYPMNHPFLRSLVRMTPLACAFTFFVAAIASAHAAESAPPPPAATTPVADPATAASRMRNTAITVDFPGGSIAQFIAQLRQSDGTTFNLIGEQSLQEVTLPKFSLRNTDLSSMVLALNSLLRPSGPTVSLSSSNIFVLTKSLFQPSSFLPQPPTFQAYQLAPYLPTVALDDITDAISTAWSANPAHDAKAVTFKFHPATKILFVYGPAEAITMATQIVPQLHPAATARAQRDFYASVPQVVPPPIAPTFTADEQARLDAIATDVRRRRAIREGQKTPPPEPSKK